ncbi:hypothetical protein K2W90_03995 [Candidatus Babeliales bacterium]|nr:hypothetical protein [Candidatus Babeliales bacterium]
MNIKKTLFFIYVLFLCTSNNAQAAATSSSTKSPDGNALHHFILQLPDDLLHHYIDTNRSILLTLTVHPAGREMIYQRNQFALRAGDLAYNRGFTPYLDILDHGIDETKQDIEDADVYFNAYSLSPVLGGNILHHFLGNLPENIYEHNIRKNIRFINRFIKRGANPKQEDADGKTPFDIALERNFTPYLYKGLFYYEEVSDKETDDRFYEEYEKYIEDNPLKRNGNILHCFLESLPKNPQDHNKDRVINALRRFIHYHEADINEKNRDNLTPYDLAYEKGFLYLLNPLEPIQYFSSSSSDNDERSYQELDYPYSDEDACDACYRWYTQLSPSEKNGNVLHCFLESLSKDHEQHDKEFNIAMLKRLIDHYEANVNAKNRENLTPYDLANQKGFLAYLAHLAPDSNSENEQDGEDILPPSPQKTSTFPFDDYDDDMPPLEPNIPDDAPSSSSCPVNQDHILISPEFFEDISATIPFSSDSKDDASHSPTPSTRSKRDRTLSQIFSSDEESSSLPCSSTSQPSQPVDTSPELLRTHERNAQKRKIQRTINFSTNKHYADECLDCAAGKCPLGPKE